LLLKCTKSNLSWDSAQTLLGVLTELPQMPLLDFGEGRVGGGERRGRDDPHQILRCRLRAWLGIMMKNR